MSVIRESVSGYRFCILGIVALLTILLGLIFASPCLRSAKSRQSLSSPARSHQTAPAGISPNPTPQPNNQPQVTRTKAAGPTSRIETANLPGSIKAILRGNRGYIRRVSLAPNCKLLASVADSASLTLWDLENRSVRQEWNLDVELRDGTTSLRSLDNSNNSDAFFTDGSLVFSPDSRTLAYQWVHLTQAQNRKLFKYVNLIRVLDVASGRFETLFSGHEDERLKGAPTGLSYTPDGKTLVAGFRDGVAILETERGKIRAILHDSKHPNSGGNAVSPRRPYLVATIADPSHVLVYDLATLAKVAELTSSDPKLNEYGRYLMVQFSPDGHRLAASTRSNGFVLWDVANWKEVAGVQEGYGSGWLLGTCYLGFTPDSENATYDVPRIYGTSETACSTS